jgi:hypothetical protein
LASAISQANLYTLVPFSRGKGLPQNILGSTFKPGFRAHAPLQRASNSFISLEVFSKSFCRSPLPHKSVNSSFNIKIS